MHTQNISPGSRPDPGPVDPWAATQPHQRYDPFAEARYRPMIKPRRSRKWILGCWTLIFLSAGALLLALVYLLAPVRTNILLLGLDARPGEGNVARTDTIILTTIIPLRPYVGALSIPRDLWVTIPGHDQNRINTAHFFGEAENPGSGPAAAMETVRLNFGEDVDYYVRIRFDGFREVVDALGGVDVDFPEGMSGYEAGVHHLNGEQALALVRDRANGDDFSRMGHSQVFLRAMWRHILKPSTWKYIPAAVTALANAADTDVPIWLWPRLFVAVARAGPNGMDMRNITREMVTPFTTTGGADVLAPNWDLINPVLLDLYGK